MIARPLCHLLAKISKLKYRHLLLCQARCSFNIITAWLSNRSSQERNIILMGPPGAGKTSVGRIIAHRLKMPIIDVDDDILEKTWGMSVAKKLAEVGGKRFIAEEGQAVCNFFAYGSVISLTGSNPLHSDAMIHLKSSGLVLYLDVDTEDILDRLCGMKVNRIVGQDAGVSMREILEYRKQFYQKWSDAQVFCGRGDSVEEVAEKVLNVLGRYQDSESETFSSTRSLLNPAENESTSDLKFFTDVAVEGLAPDGGLYIPNKGFPKLEPNEWIRLANMSYPERALVILEKCIHPLDIAPSELCSMVSQAYGQNFASESVAPLRSLGEDLYVLELFHGPTASFKDLALQLMPLLFAHCLPKMCNYLILVATSGDTGSAVLSGFRNLSESDRQRVGLLVFFPEHGVSPIQKLQMTGFSVPSAKAVSVLSDFDFCQTSIKKILNDMRLVGHYAVEFATVLSTANSINWARLLPQVVYHCSAYLDLVRDGVVKFGNPINVCIPTGNFGNAMSALYAKQMGIPIKKVICASNHNCIISDFISTGHYDLRGRNLLVSNSPAIDILKSSNLERFMHYVLGGDGNLVRNVFTSLEKEQCFRVSYEVLQMMQQHVMSDWCSEKDCLTAIQEVHTKTGYLLDTHTAVAKAVADRLHDKTCPLVLCATAHYGKFAPAVLKALQCPDIPHDVLEQLNALCAIGGHDVMHKALYESVRERRNRLHTVCQPDFNVLTNEVETMIQDLFLKVR